MNKKILPLEQIQNVDGFKFIGIDKDGDEHFCIVRKGDDGLHYMNSNTITFQELVGFFEDKSCQ